jgi:hypothetical protein
MTGNSKSICLISGCSSKAVQLGSRLSPRIEESLREKILCNTVKVEFAHSSDIWARPQYPRSPCEALSA